MTVLVVTGSIIAGLVVFAAFVAGRVTAITDGAVHGPRHRSLWFGPEHIKRADKPLPRRRRPF